MGYKTGRGAKRVFRKKGQPKNYPKGERRRHYGRALKRELRGWRKALTF